jgi:hypothetical protein
VRAAIASLLLVPIALLVLAASVLTGTVTLVSRSGLIAALKSANAGELAQRALVAEARQFDLSVLTDVAPIVRADDVPDLVRSAFPATQLQEWMEVAAGQAADWFSGQTETLHIVIDLTEGKKRIEPTLQAYLAARVASIAVCTPADAALNAAGTFRLCRPPGQSDAALLERVRASTRWDTLLASVPDSLDVANLAPAVSAVTGVPAAAAPASVAPELQQFRDIYAQRGAVLAALWGGAGLLTLFVLLLNHRPPLRMLRWVGITLVVAGVLPGVAGLAGVLGPSYVTADQLHLPARFLPEEQDAALTLLKSLAGVLLRVPLTVGIVGLALGTLALVLSFVHPHAAPATSRRSV